jgi:hypothetical protein
MPIDIEQVDIIPQERAARRFHQMATLERAIEETLVQIAAVKESLKDLNDRYQGLLLRLREAARDEGDLPLLTLMEGE